MLREKWFGDDMRVDRKTETGLGFGVFALEGK